jgi:ankyrin repeat protein
VDQPDKKYGWTPFLWAAYTGRRAEMKTLIEAGADPFTLSPMGRNALHLAAKWKDPDVLTYILDILDY